MNETDLRKILSSDDEKEGLEFKSASNDYSVLGGAKKDKRCLYGYCVGIGNAGGGRIIFGVNNDRNIVGTKAFQNFEEVKSQIYHHLGIKIIIQEVNTKEGRVVIVDVPSRQRGSLFKFYEMYVTRVGEELVEMGQDEIRQILQENIEDFTAKYLDLGINVLDAGAIRKMRQLYESENSGNNSLKNLTDEQFLSDIGLLKGGKINNAALILLGTESSLQDHLSNAEIIFEYRTTPSDIRYSDRLNLRNSLILSLDELWGKINSRNFIIPFTDGLIRREIQAFNENVVREAILNAVVHRDYEAPTSIFIKQDNLLIEIKNPGGFILDITPENVYKKSAWRNRRLAETLEKLGFVERSGQGADLIFEQTIKEGKGLPNYSESTPAEVVLKVSAIIKDKEFITYLEAITHETRINLSTDDLVFLERIKDRDIKGLRMLDMKKFLDIGIVVKNGVGRGVKYLLAKQYYKDHDRLGEYTKLTGLGRTKIKEMIFNHIKDNGRGTAKEFKQAFSELSDKDINNILQEMRKEKKIIFVGKIRQGYWSLGND